MKIKLAHKFEDIISIDNLLLAWQEFIKGKRKKKDVQEFQLHLMGNIFSLHYDLAGFSYQHGGYQAFNISDPKPRNIHKATVRDRLLHRTHLVRRQTIKKARPGLDGLGSMFLCYKGFWHPFIWLLADRKNFPLLKTSNKELENCVSLFFLALGARKNIRRIFSDRRKIFKGGPVRPLF